MFIVGITGGIGSGKSTVTSFFKEFGIPVYYADKEAKTLMNSSDVIISELKKLFGEKVYFNNQLNRALIRDQIFKDKSLLEKVNSIVHPEVAKHFNSWIYNHSKAPYILKEAAIIFENNLQHQYNCIITVVADRALRIERIMKRDGLKKATVEEIMDKQLSDDEKIKLSDFVIYNSDLKSLREQAHKIHLKLLEIIGNS